MGGRDLFIEALRFGTLEHVQWLCRSDNFLYISVYIYVDMYVVVNMYPHEHADIHIKF